MKISLFVQIKLVFIILYNILPISYYKTQQIITSEEICSPSDQKVHGTNLTGLTWYHRPVLVTPTWHSYRGTRMCLDLSLRLTSVWTSCRPERHKKRAPGGSVGRRLSRRMTRLAFRTTLYRDWKKVHAALAPCLLILHSFAKKILLFFTCLKKRCLP